MAQTPEKTVDERIATIARTTDKNTLFEAIRDKNPFVRAAVIQNDAAPAEILLEVLKNENNRYGADIRAEAALHPNADERVLNLAMQDKDLSVVEYTLSSSNATPEMLRRGIRHEDWQIRYAAAANEKAPEDVLQLALQDREEDVRQAAANNPSVSEKVLLAALDSDMFSLLEDESKPGLEKWEIEEKARESAAIIREAAAGSPNATHAVLEKALRDPHPDVWLAAAGNRAADTDVLFDAINNSRTHAVCRAVAANPAAGREIKQLAEAAGNFEHKAEKLDPEARQNLDAAEMLSRQLIAKLPQEQKIQAWLNFYTHTTERMHGRKFDAPPLNPDPAPEVPHRTSPDKPQPDRSGDIER